MFDEFSQGMFLLFVFQVWDRCFQLIGPLVDLLHFIFEIADMSIPRVFGHSIEDRKSTRLNPSHSQISYAVFCLKKKKNKTIEPLSSANTRYLHPHSSTI